MAKKNRLLLSTAFILFGFGLGMLFAHQANAERLDSNSYVLEFGNFNVTAGSKNSAGYNVTDSVGQTFAAGFGPSTNYFVGAGFQYLYQIEVFTFQISNTNIDLGELAINQHSTATTDLAISARGAGGYQLYAYEAHPLRIQGDTPIIPDTTCNNGLCSESSAQIWTTQSIPGFGFNINGDSTPPDFVDNTYFRQFADDSAAETMQVVMSSNAVTSSDQATVTFKAGINSGQTAGNYETDIVFVAVPGY